MRGYDLVISDPSTGLVWQPAASGNGFAKVSGGSTFTSQVPNPAGGGMINNPGALNIEFDCPVYNFNQPQGNTHIKVWGVGLGMIGQASQLAGANFTLSGGMRAGLPLATAQSSQYGILLQGVIYQSYGNWQSIDQTLDLICNPGAAQTGQNISFYWVAFNPLNIALAATLTQAFPKYAQNISIANLVLPNTEAGTYSTLWQFASYLTSITQQIGAATYGSQYAGVQIKVVGNTVYAYDGTVSTTPTNLAFQDLIGQPTWIDSATVNFKTVLRSDIGVGDLIKFPPGIQAPYALTSTAAATPNAPSSSKTAFQGNFVVNEVHHFASFRQPDAESWATAYSAVAAPTFSSVLLP